MSFIKYIADENHYKEVLSLVGKAKHSYPTTWMLSTMLSSVALNVQS